MIAGIVPGCVALCLEAAACAAWAEGAAPLGWAGHAFASVVAAVGSMQRVRKAERTSTGAAALLLALALPVAGALLLALVLWPAWSRAQRHPPQRIIEIALPGEVEEGDGAPAPGTASPIREVLDDVQLGAERLDALRCLRTMDARRAVPLLRLAFSHPSEDVRLLAFAILEGREKRLRAAIGAEELRLEVLGAAPEHADARRACHRRLAQQHWELVYAGFASSDLEPALLDSAARHATLGMLPGGDIATSLLLARIRLRQRRAADAWTCLVHAERAGAPRASSVPLFAEAAYALRRFADIPRLFARAEPAELRRPELLPVAQFWMGAGAP